MSCGKGLQDTWRLVGTVVVDYDQLIVLIIGLADPLDGLLYVALPVIGADNY